MPKELITERLKLGKGDCKIHRLKCYGMSDKLRKNIIENKTN
jgi:hypothetical protein